MFVPLKTYIGIHHESGDFGHEYLDSILRDEKLQTFYTIPEKGGRAYSGLRKIPLVRFRSHRTPETPLPLLGSVKRDTGSFFFPDLSVSYIHLLSQMFLFTLNQDKESSLNILWMKYRQCHGL